MAQINLGIDIGTKFCYGGFYDSGQFIPLIDKNCLSYGIPSDIIYNKKTGKFNCGDEAQDARRTLSEDKFKYEYECLGQSLKTEIRNTMHCSSDEQVMGGKTLKQITTKFIEYLLDKFCKRLSVINPNGVSNYQITQITIGYPDPSDGNTATAEDYATYMAGEVKKVINDTLSRTYANVFSNVPPDVFFVTESALAGDLMRVCDLNNLQRKILTIDIGAGTTDVCLLEKQDGREEYKAKYITNANFGGDDVDDFIIKQIHYNRSTDNLSLINAKKLLFDKQNLDKQIQYDVSEILSHVLLFNSNLQYLKESSNGGKYRIDDDRKTYEVNYDKVRDDFKSIEQTRYNEFDDMIHKLIKNDIINCGDHELSIILMGGSSRLSFIKEDLVQWLTISGDKIKSIEDSDIGEPYGINNSNFIAVGAAIHIDGQVHPLIKKSPQRARSSEETRTQSFSPRSSSSSTPKPAKVQMVEPLKATNYSSYTYGIKAANNKGYYIIVNRGISSDNEMTMETGKYDIYVNGELSSTIRPKELVFRICVKDIDICDIDKLIDADSVGTCEQVLMDNSLIKIRNPIEWRSTYRYNAPYDDQLLLEVLDKNGNTIAEIKNGKVRQKSEPSGNRLSKIFKGKRK